MTDAEKLRERILSKLPSGLRGITLSYCEYASKYYVERNYMLYNLFKLRAKEWERYLRSQFCMSTVITTVVRSYKARAVAIARKQKVDWREVYSEFVDEVERIIDMFVRTICTKYVSEGIELVDETIRKMIDKEMLKYMGRIRFKWR